MKRVASSRKESRGPEQNWSSSDKLAAGASSRGRGLRMVEDAMTAAADVIDTSTAKQQTWCECKCRGQSHGSNEGRSLSAQDPA